MGAHDVCTLDVTRGMTKGFTHLCSAPDEAFASAPADFRAFREWLKDREQNKFSYFDGGQIMYNIVILEEGALLWAGHSGAYEGAVKSVVPKPDVAILGVAGRGNLGGKLFDGSAAEMAAAIVGWLGEPKKVVFALWDEMPMNLRRVDTRAAKDIVESKTGTSVWDLKHAEMGVVFE